MVAIYRPTYLAGLRWLFKLDLQGWSRMVGGLRPKCLAIEEIKTFLAEGYSLLRWGDGETANLREKTTWHQTSDPDLAKLLNQLLQDLTSTKKRVLFGLPLNSLQGSLLNPRSFAWSHRKQLWSSRVLFNLKRFRDLTNGHVFDSGIFYNQYSAIPGILKSLNTHARNILYISSTDAPVLKDHCLHLSHLAIPKKDAFTDLERIRTEALSWLSASGSDPLILFSGGSTVKALFLELVERCQVVDLGSGVRFLESSRITLDWENETSSGS